MARKDDGLATLKSDSLRVLRSEALVQQLAEEIVVGKLPAGTRLGTKEDLRLRFEVSAATVNEAVRMLEMRGLVAARPGPGGGLFVRGNGPTIQLQHVTLKVKEAAATAVRDALAVRHCLELSVCAEAGQFHTKRDLAKLGRIVSKLEAVTEPGDYLPAIWQLHRAIARICPNEVLRDLYIGLLDSVESSIETALPDDDLRSQRNQDHRELIDAIGSRDQKLITQAVAKHNAQSLVHPPDDRLVTPRT